MFVGILLMLPLFLIPLRFIPYIGLAVMVLDLVLTPILILLFLVMLIPLCFAGVRRIHDTGNSGALWLINLVPFGFIYVLFILCTKESMPEENKYGPVPVE